MALTRIGSVGLSTGININAGVGTFTGDLTVGGVLTYEDVTNVDSIGIITARAGVKVGSGITLSSDGDIFFTGIMTGNGSGLTGVANTDVIFTDKLSVGDSPELISVGVGSDLQIFHDGNNRIQASNGYILLGSSNNNIYLDANNIQLRSADGTEKKAKFVDNGASELYHDNSKKLETASGGVTVTGTLAATAVTGDGSGLTGIGGTDFIHAEQISTTGIVTATSFVPTVGQLSHRNIVINGAMKVAEHGTSSAGGEGYKTVDRFQYYKSGTNETPNQAQVDVAAGTTPYTLGFRKAYQVENGNQSSAGGSDLVFIETNLEAQDIVNSGWNYLSSSSYITLSFWVKSSVAQNFYGYLITVDGTAYKYPFETGSLSADTWTKVTKTIPGNSNLQFDNNSDKGLGIVWWPFLGDGYTDSGVSLDTWATWSSGTRTPDATNTWYLTNDSTFEITGVQLEAGPVATPFEHRSFQDELLRCQRYYYAHKGPLWGHVSAGDHLDVALYFPVPMRATPSFNQVDTSILYKNRLNQGNSISANTYTVTGGMSKYGAMWVARPASGEAWDTSSGRIYYYHVAEGTTSYEFSAEI